MLCYLYHGGKFLWGANFHYFCGSFASHENFHPRKFMPVQSYQEVGDRSLCHTLTERIVYMEGHAIFVNFSL